jgi:hypothetical protein
MGKWFPSKATATVNPDYIHLRANAATAFKLDELHLLGGVFNF